MAMKEKTKEPERVKDIVATEYYEKYGNAFVEEGEIKVGYRYDHVEGRKMRMPDGKEFTNNVTLSAPSAEILTLLKDGDEWYFVLGKQSRSPYVVDVNDKLYSKVFLEQAAGLLEEGQDFKDAAIAETSQELGAKLVFLQQLVIPKICRHVSYADEVSKIYIAVTEKIEGQELDGEDHPENINVECIPIDEARDAFENYIDGTSPNFFGFDIPEMTMLSMVIFFWKLDDCQIDLSNLEWSFGKNLI